MWTKEQVAVVMAEVNNEQQRLLEALREIKLRSVQNDDRRETAWANCPHEFSKPLKGYEHEGGNCIHCGIGELYAPTFQALQGKHKVSDAPTEEQISSPEQLVASQYLNTLKGVGD